MSRELRLLFQTLGRYKGRYALGCFFLACSDLGQLAVPWLVGQVIDRLQAGSLDEAGVRLFAMGIVAASLFVAVVRFGWRIFVFGSARMIDRDLRQRLYEHLQALSLSFHLRHKVGDLMAHATNDVAAVRAAASEGVMSGFDAIAMASFATIIMVGTVDARLAFFALAPMLLLPIICFWLGERLHLWYDKVQEAFSGLSDRAQENIAGVRVVKGFGRELHQEAVFAEANATYQANFARMLRFDVAFDPVINMLAGASFAVGLGYGGLMVLNGQLSLGQYVAFNSYLTMLLWPMLALGWVMNILQRATASVGRLQKIFDSTPDVFDGPDAQPIGEVRGHLTLKGLSFGYAPGLPPVLDGIDLEAAPGALIGILGSTGAGKSTLANLTVRLFNPPRGQVLLDGRDINDIRLADLRGAIAYVPQDGFLFSRSIAENIAFDPLPHTPEEVIGASRRAQLDGDVQDFPLGYETMLGERGVTLSGGQRQRLGIARALIKDAKVLVLDDCLSAVDTATEARLLAELVPLMQGRTTLLISHRTSALQYASEILVLAEGRVVERGTHASLLTAQGEYARVHRKQQLEAAIEGMG